MSHRRYLVGCFVAAVIAGASIALFNWVVDPAGVFGHSPDGIYVFSERPYKMVQVRTYPHRVLLVGSSKSAAFDPATLKQPRVYNASFAVAMPEETLAFIEQRGRDAEIVLIGLDFYMFRGDASTLKRNITLSVEGFPATAKYLFSLPMFLDAVQHLFLFAIGRPPLIAPNGHWNLWGREELERAPWEVLDRRRMVMNKLRSDHFADGEFATARLDVLHRMRELLEKRGQAYRVFINPLEACVLKMLAGLPSHAQFERFRKEIRTVFPDVLDYSVSAYSAPRNFYRFDPYHYKTNVATMLIRDVLDGRPPKPPTSETAKCSN
ncbi:MAG: hypothetical protein QF654_09875 [Alphaproteobacteria bacterium]|nr:hypothetical protein [Alphaproteobacteria bacterium]